MVQHHLFSVLNACFPHPPKALAVAVSGGVDSMALTHGLQLWAKQSDTTEIVPLIVDHGLRQNSEEEAHHVAEILKNEGLRPVILHWNHGPLHTGLMEKARYGRYATLAMACHQRNIEHLLVGHHQDDMLETVWMRQQMQGPAHGFSGMSAVTMRCGVVLLRPLLRVAKLELEAWMRSRGLPWVQDPTNQDMRFHRTLARQTVQQWSAESRKNAIQTIENFGLQRETHEKNLRQLTSCKHHPGYILVNDFLALTDLSVADGALWIQSWAHSFSFRSMAKIAAQHRLWRVLQNAFSEKSWKSGGVIATFAGCIFVRHNRELWIFREYAHLSQDIVKGDKNFWDDRVFSRTPMFLQRAIEPHKGPWKERFMHAGLPQGWDPEMMQYRACSWPYPHFSTLQNCALSL